ncbi:MAG: putative xylulose kinase [Streblomastix strix]|uniref:Putative xylulose kinase n=2 Tax=Streblomastix strix TaxID=222440 RepID=A0A5J4UW87_9EUKA|nr:MAG: putative xylulose kinase [Streblomastix strix]
MEDSNLNQSGNTEQEITAEGNEDTQNDTQIDLGGTLGDTYDTGIPQDSGREQVEDQGEEEEEEVEEGLDDNDFQNADESLNEGLSMDQLKQYYDQALMEHTKLMADNYDLQRKYLNYLLSNPTEIREEERPEEETKALFYDALKHIEGLREETVALNESANTVLSDVREKVIEKQEALKSAKSHFEEYKLNISGNSRYKQTERPIEDGLITALMEREAKKDEEIQMRRLKNVTLQTALAKYDETHKKASDAKSQRHQIDFEQLKIENQTYNEKIEERTEELQKLRKKINMTVHVLSHFTEKLEFLHAANGELKEKLGELERETASKRDMLANIKLERDRLKVENQHLRQENGLVGNEELLKDFKERRKNLNNQKRKLYIVQQKYAAITGEDVSEYQTKLLGPGGQEGLIAGAPGEEEEEEEDREVEDEELGEALQDEVDAQAKTSGK